MSCFAKITLSNTSDFVLSANYCSWSAGSVKAIPIYAASNYTDKRACVKPYRWEKGVKIYN